MNYSFRSRTILSGQELFFPVENYSFQSSTILSGKELFFSVKNYSFRSYFDNIPQKTVACGMWGFLLSFYRITFADQDCSWLPRYLSLAT